MPPPIYINLVYEDDLSEFVLLKILKCFGNKYIAGTSYSGGGFGYIKSSINGFNQACKTVPFLVLTDLDTNPCPIEIINSWFNMPVHPNMIFRVAIKEVESWLLADIDGISSFFRVSKANFPTEPEKENDPKQLLINLAKKSPKRNIREDIVPVNSNAKIGPNYNGCLAEFVIQHWNVERAIQRSDSLYRAYNRLNSF